LVSSGRIMGRGQCRVTVIAIRGRDLEGGRVGWKGG